MKNCELCGKPAELDFNCWLPSFGLMVVGDVCLACMGAADGDMQIAVALVKKRAIDRGVALPVKDAEMFAKLAER